MPVDQATVLNIDCDNPICPGNSLDPREREGWLFISSEVYGTPTQSFVFCCGDCLGAEATRVASPPSDAEPKPA